MNKGLDQFCVMCDTWRVILKSYTHKICYTCYESVPSHIREDQKVRYLKSKAIKRRKYESRL